jgi:hypothetical protein
LEDAIEASGFTVTRAALILLRKTESWSALAQNERRAIFVEQSHHIYTGLEYLPAIARRLRYLCGIGKIASDGESNVRLIFAVQLRGKSLDIFNRSSQ